MSKQLIQLIPEPYRLPAIIFFALFPWLVVGIVAFKAWRIAVKKRHAQLAYRALEEHCTCVLEAVTDHWPDIREFHGQELVAAIKERLLSASIAKTKADIILSSIESKNLPENMPPAIRWYVRQVQYIQRFLEAAEYEHGGNPAQCVGQLLDMDRLVTAPAFIVALKDSHLKPARARYGVEEMEKQFRATIGKLAMYAPSTTFCDSLPKFAEDVLDVATEARAKYVLRRGQEEGILTSEAFHSLMAIAEEKPL